MLWLLLCLKLDDRNTFCFKDIIVLLILQQICPKMDFIQYTPYIPNAY